MRYVSICKQGGGGCILAYGVSPQTYLGVSCRFLYIPNVICDLLRSKLMLNTTGNVGYYIKRKHY